jgi:serine/threonine-protein kinase
MPDADSDVSFSPGAQIGPYRIEALLGRGGMGEVWKARDQRLNRTVAIKISRSEFTDRFQREALMIAALSHPRIGALFDVGAGPSGFGYLVLEYVAGPTLDEVIARGPMPHAQALRVALQIAEAIEAAHDRGIVHRDLKPSNIKLAPDGSVKVLDFGLAKALEAQYDGGDADVTMPARTQTAVIVGTPAYMSPEQASGEAIDRRTDIWSFGVIVSEMVTGARLFGASTVRETIAAVLKGDLELERVPLEWRWLIQRCLDRDPRRRLQSIGEARIALEDGLPRGGQTDLKARAWIWPAATAVAVTVALAAAAWTFASRPDVQLHPARFSVDLGRDAIDGHSIPVAISPDGTRIVYPMKDASGRLMLGTRLLKDANAAVLSKTENGRDPFFSPDGKWIGFFADGKLRKIPAQGGAVVDLANAPDGRGASWSDGSIVVALDSSGGLSRIPENAGPAQSITHLKDDQTHRWPQVLPQSGDVVFTAASAGTVKVRVMALSAKTGEVKTLVDDAYFGRVLPSGDLVYLREGALWGTHFDSARLEVIGSPTKLLDDVLADRLNVAGLFDVSASGLIAYRSGRSGLTEYPVLWMDKSGRTTTLVSRPDAYQFPNFSPHGEKILLNGGEGPYIYDVASGTLLSRVSNARAAQWMPDGRHLLVRRATATGSSIVYVNEDGTGDDRVLLEATGITLSDVSSDGSLVLYNQQAADTTTDVWALSVDLTDPDRPKPGKPRPLLNSRATETGPRLSPDGRWLAYCSDESGRFEIYVRSFPGLGGKVRVSNGVGDNRPAVSWSRTRSELFFYGVDGHITVVEYSVQGASFVPAKPTVWSPTPVRALAGVYNLALHPDGQRFAVLPADTIPEGGVQLTFLVDFLDEFRKRIDATGQ